MFADVNSLFLDNLMVILGVIRVLTRTLTWSETLIKVTVGSISALFMVLTLIASGAIALFNHKVRRALHIWLILDIDRISRLQVHLLQSIWVLAYVIKDITALLILLRPLCHIVARLLFLKSLKDQLVLPGDPHQISSASIPIETLFELHVGWDSCCCCCHLRLLSDLLRVKLF